MNSYVPDISNKVHKITIGGAAYFAPPAATTAPDTLVALPAPTIHLPAYVALEALIQNGATGQINVPGEYLGSSIYFAMTYDAYLAYLVVYPIESGAPEIKLTIPGHHFDQARPQSSVDFAFNVVDRNNLIVATSEVYTVKTT